MLHLRSFVKHNLCRRKYILASVLAMRKNYLALHDYSAYIIYILNYYSMHILFCNRQSFCFKTHFN